MRAASERHVALALYDALDGRDTTAVAIVLDEASVLHVSGGSGLAGDYQGGEAIVGLLGRMADLTEGTLRHSTAHPASEMHGAIVLRGRASGSRRGRFLDTDVEVTVTVRGGIVREAWVSCLDQAGCDDFWS